MMIAHQLIDYVAEHTPEQRQFVASAFGRAVHFDAGDLGGMPDWKHMDHGPLMARAPFPETLVQFEHPSHPVSHFLILFHETDAEHWVMFAAHKLRGTGEWQMLGRREFVCHGTWDSLQVFGRDEEQEKSRGTGDNDILYLTMVKQFFYLLGCSNVVTVDVPAPAPLNKKRAKKGAAPIQTYKTLHLVVPTVNGARANLGGTHNSPRVHLRRGHVRQLQDGRRIWVQACVVGAKHGVVHKDYAISYGVAA